MRAVAFLFLASCVASAGGDDGESTTAEAPLVGVDGSLDQADRNCNVVLRDLGRNNINGFTYETNGSSWVWSGVVEISQAAANEGLVPNVIYHYNGTAWTEATITPIDATHFRARLDQNLVGPGMSATAITTAKIDVVPYIRMAGGGRLFDHNRNADDFANYRLSYPDYAIFKNDAVCAAPATSQHANVIFDATYHQRVEGMIAAGGSMSVLYDIARLPTCRQVQGGLPQYDITANVKFSSGQTLAASVRDGAANFTVPTDGAKTVSIYFETTSVSGCHAYDSNYGNNYVFDLATAPQWIGNAQNLMSRATTDPCDGGVPAEQSFTFSSWSRERAAYTNLCFEVYQPGLTDHDDPDLWKKLDAGVRWHRAGDPVWTTTAANIIDRRGNNARYAMSWRPLDPYHLYGPTPPGTETIIEYVIVVNGSEIRPAPGAAFSGTFSR